MWSSKAAKIVATVVAVVAAFLALVVSPSANAADTWPQVRQGAGGPDVVTVQYLLRQHGHDIPADGDFGPVTAAAVTAFQSARGLVADGMVGSQTWPHLVVTVRQGSEGDAVRAAQTQLNSAGAGIPVDGRFGPVTDGAVRAFQSAHGLAADGEVGPRTWQSLLGVRWR